MKMAYVFIGCTGKVISSRHREVLFPAQGPGENSPGILCINWVICVQPRQAQMHAGVGHGDEKTVEIRENCNRFSYKTKSEKGHFFCLSMQWSNHGGWRAV